MNKIFHYKLKLVQGNTVFGAQKKRLSIYKLNQPTNTKTAKISTDKCTKYKKPADNTALQAVEKPPVLPAV